MGNNIVDFNRNADYYVETLIMDNYMNFADQPHTLTITHRKTNQLILKKKFDTESLAVAYLNEAREYQNNKQTFQFVILGPNMYYSL